MGEQTNSTSFQLQEAAAGLAAPLDALQRWLIANGPHLDRLHEEAVRRAGQLLAQTVRALRERAN